MRCRKGQLCLIWDGENELEWDAGVNEDEDEIWVMEMAMMKIGMSTAYGAKGRCRISACT